MAETEQLKIQIVMDDGSVKDAFIDLEKKAKQAEGSLDGLFSGLKGKIAGLGAAFAAAFTVKKAFDFMRESAAAAMEAEQAVNALSASLRQIGKFTPQALKDFEDYAGEMQKLVGVSDDLIKQNAAVLASLGGLSGDGLKRASTAALDLAQALQIDVGTAFDLVSKAASGNATMLGRYGIHLDKNIPKSQQFAAALDLIEKKFGGLARTRLDTLEGSITNLRNAFADFQEEIGNILVKSPALRAVINTLAKSFYDLADSVKSSVSASTDPLYNLITTILEFAKVVNTYLIVPLELAFNGIKIIFNGFIALNQGLIAMWVNLGNLFLSYVIEPIIKGVGWLGEKVVGLFDADMAAKIKSNMDSFATSIGSSLGTAADSTTEVFKDSLTDLSNSADNIFNFKVANGIDNFIDRLKTAAENSKNITNDMKNNIVQNTGEINETLAKFNKSATELMQQSLSNAVSQGLSKIGESLVKGENAFDNFGKVILGILGDFAIQVGTLMVSMGFGFESLKVALATWNGAALIAAGAALVVLGGALKALSGGLGSNAAPAASGGGLASSPSAATDLTPTTELQRQEPQTAVQLTIEGSVYDSDETGSRIVSLINDAFSKKGVVINQGVMA